MILNSITVLKVQWSMKDSQKWIIVRIYEQIQLKEKLATPTLFCHFAKPGTDQQTSIWEQLLPSPWL